MAHKIIDRCKETTSTTGTGNLTLTGAASGFVSMASVLTSNGDTSWFCAEAGAQWEVFLGTRASSTTLQRTTVISSSNAGAAVDFTSPPVVFSTIPGSRLLAEPSFCAYMSTDQTGIANATWTKVQLSSEEFDLGSCFDSAANFRFTPSVAGRYRFEWSVGFYGASIGVGQSALNKNGAVARFGSYAAPAYGYAYSTGAGILLLSTTDYVELYGYMTASSGHKFIGSQSGTFLSASFLGP
jgi:hypothetical protein